VSRKGRPPTRPKTGPIVWGVAIDPDLHNEKFLMHTLFVPPGSMIAGGVIEVGRDEVTILSQLREAKLRIKRQLIEPTSVFDELAKGDDLVLTATGESLSAEHVPCPPQLSFDAV